jgi:hypothetical protein
MEETKHNTLCSELEKMIDCGPGENEAGLQRVREIVLAYEGDFGSSSSIRESALEVLGGLRDVVQRSGVAEVSRLQGAFESIDLQA